MKTTLNLRKLAKQISSIEVISKENKWSFFYDDELDSLYFSPKEIQDRFTMFSVTDEFSVYVDQNSNLGGIFIEYYKTNLSSHEEKFKPFKRLFEKRTMNKENRKQKEVLLSEVLKAELLSGIVSRDNQTAYIPGI